MSSSRVAPISLAPTSRARRAWCSALSCAIAEVAAASLRVTALLAAFVLADAATPPRPAHAARSIHDPVDQVNPFIGTGGHGHTFPGATLPFGMVQLSPDTRLTGWDGCSGYHDSDRRVFGFSHTHLSGTGVSDYGDILVLPATGPIRWKSGYAPADSATGYGSFFQKSNEKASPGYYAVTLDDYGVRAELTATLRAGLHRYRFTNGDPAHLLVDLTHRDEVMESTLRVVNDHEIEGLRRSRAWAQNQRVYFVLRTSKPFRPLLAVGDTVHDELTAAAGKNVKAALRFDTRPGEVVMVKVGISAVDIEGARRNLDEELSGWDFRRTHEAARAAWRKQLNKIEIVGGTPDQRTIFYTALYHTMIQPNTWSDVDHRFRGRDDQVHTADGYTRYTVFSLWDTFRAAHPLYTILEPERTVDFIKTFLAQYQESGRLPVWELAGTETDCMIGYHAVSVIADAYMKGIRGFDVPLALEAMKAAAERQTPGLDAYRRFGYIPSDVEAESVSKTLEYAYDDWCIAGMASAPKILSESVEIYRRSYNWQNLLDPATRFMRAKKNSQWTRPFNPREVDFNFTEANSWQYSFFVPHNPLGPGGRSWLIDKLDSLFTAPAQTTGREQADITGLIGQYAHGNEPSHHIAYLYDFAGEPWKAQQRVRQILDTFYTNRPDGLIGNEDCGQMSAWYVLSALGIYSACPGNPWYVIGAPLFPRATLKLDNGKSFVIRTKGGGAGRPYVQSATFGAGRFNQLWLGHADITAGGALEFRMGASANENWGFTDRWGGERQFPGDLLGTDLLATRVPWVMSGESPFHDRTRVALSDSGSIRYTLDGTEPSMGSALYSQPIELTSTTTVRFRTADAKYGVKSFPVQSATFHRIPGHRKVVSLSPTHRQYTAGGNDAFIDGIRGGNDFRLGTWLGFYGIDMDGVVDLGEELTLRHLAVGFLQDQNSWIFMPRAVSFDTSLDGVTWQAAGSVANDVDEHADGVVLKDFGVTLPAPRQARFVRAHATAPIMCPEWHKGAGNRSFIFADELITE